MDTQGCYREDPSSRVMSYLVGMREQTPEMCKTACRDRGYMYAGVQVRNKCIVLLLTTESHETRKEDELFHLMRQ